MSAVIEHFVGWKSSDLENNRDGVDMLQPFMHHTALCWYWGAECDAIMNDFNVQVGLMKAYYERFVYYLTEFIRKCIHSMCSYYKNIVRQSKHIPGNVTLLNEADTFLELTHPKDWLASMWATGHGSFGRIEPPAGVIAMHRCSMSCRSYPQIQDDRERLQRSHCGHTLGDRMVREHVAHLRDVNYSWSRVVCIACISCIPPRMIQTAASLQGSSSSSVEEPNTKKWKSDVKKNNIFK